MRLVNSRVLNAHFILYTFYIASSGADVADHMAGIGLHFPLKELKKGSCWSERKKLQKTENKLLEHSQVHNGL